MWGADRMIEFIDETSEKLGTEFSRENMMAIQGYQNEDVTFGDTITKINDKGETETITFLENQIIKRFVGEKTVNQTITFNENGYTRRLS